MINRKHQHGFTLVELVLSFAILAILLVALAILLKPATGTGPTGTTFTVKDNWVQAPIVIANNEQGVVIYNETISGVGVPGITIRYEIEGSNHVLITSTMNNESSSWDTSVNPPIETTEGEINTDSSGEAVLKLSALSNGGVKVRVFVIDGAGNSHKDPVIKQMEIDTDPNAVTKYTP